MWWFAAIPVLWVGKKVYDYVSEDDAPPTTQAKSKSKTVLEKNLSRLKKELRNHSGKKVAIIGQPGAGKSSLLIKMTGDKVVPRPVVGVETDATNWSEDKSCNLLSHFDGIVFADVPGYDTASHPEDVFSSNFPFESFDAFIFVVKEKFYSADVNVFRKIVGAEKEVCIARSCSDGLNDDERDLVIMDIQEKFKHEANERIIFFSNISKEGIKAISTFART